MSQVCPKKIAKAEAIEGWMSRGELIWLAEQALTWPIIIEFGSWKGRSTKSLASHVKGLVYAVDVWKNGDAAMEFLTNLRDEIGDGRCAPMRCTSAEFEFPHAQAGMVFIDANHDYNSVCADIMKARSCLKSGGLLCGHDFSESWPGVMMAVKERVPNYQLHETIWYAVN